MWVDDEDYPDGRRLPMDPNEQAGVDAVWCDVFADALGALDSPDRVVQDAARELTEAARLLRLGID